jgi:thioredoxin reductase (NADPH)
VVVATGARYRRLDVGNLETKSSCVHYCASPIEAKLCAHREVGLVGAGNSTGQAAVYLASQDVKVWILARRAALAETMSRYLVGRIDALANVEVVTGATVSGVEGDGGVLQAIRWRLGTGQEIRRPVSHLFLFIGAEPNTDWLSASGVALDAKGFILTGVDAGMGRHPLETTRRGLFARGDARAKSVKRVAAAVGKGAQVVAAIHTFLAADLLKLPIVSPIAVQSH